MLVTRSIPFRVSSRRAHPTAIRKLSTLASYQKARWNAYLASGRGSIELFRSIDADNTGIIKPDEIKVFLQAVGSTPTSVHPKAFQHLDQLAKDHPLTLHEFQDWLIEATKSKAGHSTKVDDYESRSGPRAAAAEQPHAKHVAGVFAWNESTMSQSLRRMQYAVRGEIVNKADALLEQGRKIIFTNIGNPQSLGQPPLTYYRQVLALCDLPAECGVQHPLAANFFPKDVVDRALELRSIIGPSGTGAYTNSQGVQGFRQHVADFITSRDGHPAYAGDIFLTNGASSAIDMILTALLSGDSDAIMIPIPQYPLYSASITRLGGRQVGYYLDETQGWTVTRDELQLRLDEARNEGLSVKGMVLINPGNPTGQVMQRPDLELVCQFCAQNGIVLLADEVYQRNIYDDNSEFISTKKVATETPGCEDLEMVSFHSTSKGLIGECGRRGGYMELHGIDPKVHSQLYKLASSGLCSGVAGQIMTSLMVRGPQPGDDSYERFQTEESAIFSSLKRRAEVLVKGLNDIDGIACNPAKGAMYAFPRVSLSDNALDAAEQLGQTPDTLYALSLLDETGICVVPASGFGQKSGRIGFRTTFLPPEDELYGAIGELKRHHEVFCERYG